MPTRPQECNRYGTTLRFFIDPAKVGTDLDQPGERSARPARDGDDVIQEGRDGAGNLIRWVFTDIRPASARWYGESSTDGGKSSKLGAEFFPTRVGESPAL
jgi:hypothetical protein